MGIKKLENQILDKAKKDQKKIDESKRRFRESLAGNQQFSNGLRDMDIKKKVDKFNEQF